MATGSVNVTGQMRFKKGTFSISELVDKGNGYFALQGSFTPNCPFVPKFVIVRPTHNNYMSVDYTALHNPIIFWTNGEYIGKYEAEQYLNKVILPNYSQIGFDFVEGHHPDQGSVWRVGIYAPAGKLIQETIEMTYVAFG